MDSSSKIVLPPRYYLDNFLYVLEIVKRLYGHLLTPEEQSFIARFEVLSQDAQCLYVRFSNRKGLFFRVNKLNYPEITDVAAALAELQTAGFAEPLAPHHTAIGTDALSVFTKPELLQRLPLEPDERRQLAKEKKETLLLYVLRELAFSEVISSLTATEPVVKMNFETESMMLKYLFFGNRSSSMTDFVIRDLGMVNVERHDDSQLTARFQTRQEVEDKLLLSLTAESFYDQQTAEVPAPDIFDWFMNWNETRPNPLAGIAQPAYHKLVCRVGAFLERQKLPEQALTVFELTDRAPARERRARLLLKTNATDEALALCDEIALQPQNAEETYFAQDFSEKIRGQTTRKRTRKATTRFLLAADTLAIPATYRHQVEVGVMQHYIDAGYEAVFTENYPWRGLFGLVFWDIIYDTNAAAFHHPLQRAPSDFYLPDFFRQRETRIRQRLHELATKADWLRHTADMFQTKFGFANTLFEWSDDLWAMVEQLIGWLEVTQLQQIVLEMALNVREHTRGFPDLLIWKQGVGYELIEVKSPTDHLGSQQLYWLEFFGRIGVSARIARVVWQ